MAFIELRKDYIMDLDKVLNITNIICPCILAFCAIITLVRKEPNNGKKKSSVKKKQPELYIMTAAFLLLSIIFIWQLISGRDTPVNTNPIDQPKKMDEKRDTILVFAGGGSVRSFLDERFNVDVRTQPHSINIAIASGSAWRVLAEEYQFRQIKDNDSIQKFNTICLSAGKMSKEFYSEYMSGMIGTIVTEVYLGDDNLVAYISNDLSKYWSMTNSKNMKKKNHISLDVLAQKLQCLIESDQVIKLSNNKTSKVSIFTTNKTSGTLEAYKKCFQDLKKLQDSMMLFEFKKSLDTIKSLDSTKRIDTIKSVRNSIRRRDSINLEMMIENKQVYIYYDNMIAEEVLNKAKDGEYIMLGSEYYHVGGMDNNPLYLCDGKSKPIHKPMYLYFLAYKHDNNSNKFLIDKNILEFLNLNLGYKKMKNVPKSDPNKWKVFLEKGIIEYDISGTLTEPIRIN